MQNVIGYVDRSWKPPKKSKLELQIELEDNVWYSMRKNKKPKWTERIKAILQHMKWKKWEPTPKYVFGVNVGKFKQTMP